MNSFFHWSISIFLEKSSPFLWLARTISLPSDIFPPTNIFFLLSSKLSQNGGMFILQEKECFPDWSIQDLHGLSKLVNGNTWTTQRTGPSLPFKTSVPRSQGSLKLMNCSTNLTSSRTHGNWLLALNFTNIYDHNHLLGCGVCFNLLEEVLQISPGSPDPWPFPHPFCWALPALLNFKNTTAFLTITQDKKDHIFILKIVFYFSILFFQDPPPQ